RASFALEPADPSEVKATLAAMRAQRREAQPSGIKTFGSTFKNPDDPRAQGRSAGVLLDEAGCRGFQVGGARFSEKHANFVENTGLSGPQARSIREALTDAGLGMTTLHVRDGDLRDAVSTYPVVRSVSASGDFPHLLRIQVELNLPVAALQTPAGRVPLTADGVLLRDVPLTSGLPTLAAR